MHTIVDYVNNLRLKTSKAFVFCSASFPFLPEKLHWNATSHVSPPEKRDGRILANFFRLCFAEKKSTTKHNN